MMNNFVTDNYQGEESDVSIQVNFPFVEKSILTSG